jgi:PhnB protein
MIAQPYLSFEGACEEALNFYRDRLGAEIVCLMRFKENPQPESCGGGPAPDPEKVMHAGFKLGDSLIMATDGRCSGERAFHGFSLALTVRDKAEADRLFAAAGEGGQVCMPMAETFFSPAFGMVTDRFGVSWMILAEQPSGG